MTQSSTWTAPTFVLSSSRATADAAKAARLMARRAWDAAMAAQRERIAAWLDWQRNDIPATGAEFAAAIRGNAEERR